MRVEGGLVLIEFVEHHLVAAVVREQNVELKGARFILEAAGCMRPQQRQELVPAPGRTSIDAMSANFGIAASPFLRPLMGARKIIACRIRHGAGSAPAAAVAPMDR